MAEGCEVVTKLFSVVWMQEHVRIQGLLGRVLSRDHKGRTAGCGLRDRKCHFYPEVLRPIFLTTALWTGSANIAGFLRSKDTEGVVGNERANERAWEGTSGYCSSYPVKSHPISSLRQFQVSTHSPFLKIEGKPKTRENQEKEFFAITCFDIDRDMLT